MHTVRRLSVSMELLDHTVYGAVLPSLSALEPKASQVDAYMYGDIARHLSGIKTKQHASDVEVRRRLVHQVVQLRGNVWCR